MTPSGLWKRRDLIKQIPVAICGVLGARTVFIQNANAQLLEKKVLTLVAARKLVAAAEAEAERNHLAGSPASWVTASARHRPLPPRIRGRRGFRSLS